MARKRVTPFGKLPIEGVGLKIMTILYDEMAQDGFELVWSGHMDRGLPSGEMAGENPSANFYVQPHNALHTFVELICCFGSHVCGVVVLDPKVADLRRRRLTTEAVYIHYSNPAPDMKTLLASIKEIRRSNASLLDGMASAANSSG